MLPEATVVSEACWRMAANGMLSAILTAEVLTILDYTGSEHNDEFYIDEAENVRTRTTNHSEDPNILTEVLGEQPKGTNGAQLHRADRNLHAHDSILCVAILKLIGRKFLLKRRQFNPSSVGCVLALPLNKKLLASSLQAEDGHYHDELVAVLLDLEEQVLCAI
ncbi:hypothetical protein GUJ93_ZPchr0013g37764 [Zizania palustris]|uniref:Uncharacterized protein n=1 Tax=Zizania palustris TaxID=103762 RepID=A0A8J5WVC2_ZIZPA|nr:hypothetical protein GUJ93_ZPchr0013g37764 [Zizania palustris]